MGVNLKDLLIRKEITIPELRDKKLVIDGNNVLYQFLATIRQVDGTPLTDSSGNITSHITGVFHRTARLMQYGIKPAFVFDGTPPDLKKRELERRRGIKETAKAQYESAKASGDIEGMKKFSMRTSRLTKEMIAEAVELISALGLPTIQAPSEGEAQAAILVKKGEVYAEISQDYDCLLFGVPRMIQNLTISERKKRKDKISFETVKPQVLSTEDNLKHLGISQDQLICLGILIGTDFDVGGIKGIGPKKAISLVEKHGSNFNELFEEAEWDKHYDYPWTDVFKLFKEMPTTDDYTLDWKKINSEKVFEILCEKHDFSKTRVQDVLDKLETSQSRMAQKGLGDFF